MCRPCGAHHLYPQNSNDSSILPLPLVALSYVASIGRFADGTTEINVPIALIAMCYSLEV